MFVMLKKELKFLEEIKKGKRESRKQNQKIPTTMTWNAITGKPSFLSVNYVDVTINGGNGSGNINISQYTSGYSAVVPVLINTTTGNWDINVGIQGNLLIAAGSGVAEGYQVMVRLYRFK